MFRRNNKVKKAAKTAAIATQKYILFQSYHFVTLTVSSSIAVATHDKVQAPLPVQVPTIEPPMDKPYTANKLTPAPISIHEKVAHIQNYLNYMYKVFHDTLQSLVWFKTRPDLFELKPTLRYQRLLIEAGIRLARPGWHPDTLRHGRKALKGTTFSKLQQGTMYL